MAESDRPGLILPDWPLSERVRAVITTRTGGVSREPYGSLNLGDHVGDDPVAVRMNRERLASALDLPAGPLWLKQVHGCRVAAAGRENESIEADASSTDQPGVVCAVLTADCLPVLLCNRDGSRVAAAHAGWRGLAEGVIENALKTFAGPPGEILAWLGPAIGPAAFEVGPEVRTCFVSNNPADAGAFRPGEGDRWFADIYQLARNRLARLGVGYVGGGQYCTVTDSERFFSYRRDGVTGRFASLIWIEPETGL